MSNIAIRVENLSKKYWIGKTHSSSFRETIDSTIRNLVGGKKASRTEFWALHDISCQINQGEAVGIIGRNGAGKSTLLKILSRITVPTKGKITINGRVSSLLEVGTGFHAELTGRENIYMNGSLLGMKQREIRRKFDEIVEFSGVEKFIDTPVKYYSSGMYVRLAFAVAAHLEPEILIVDEVLAVGDVEFQRKCLGKMEEVGQQGRTILFVSHNMLAIKSLCSRCYLLKDGQVAFSGDANEATNQYLSLYSPTSQRIFDDNDPKYVNDMIKLNSLELKTKNESGRFYITEPLSINVILINKTVTTPINVNLFFNAPDGTNIFATCSLPKSYNKGEINLTCNIPANYLNDNTYSIDIMVVSDFPESLLKVNNALLIEGIEPPRKGGGWLGKFPGYIKPSFEWITS